MNSIPAQEVKRRGMSAVDDAMKNGPVYVIRNNQPQYIVLTIERYRELAGAEHQLYIDRVRHSLEDAKAGRLKHVAVEDLIRELNLEG